ncbi:MAG: hypothetical protein FJ265_15720 [Planctomycetes bacterium]|nr:hypothetical protein [Planctomycetota bacterium]
MSSAPPSPAFPEPDLVPRLVGGAIGAALGIGAYWFGLQRGIDLLVVVGVLPAYGIARGSRRRSAPWALGTALAAPALAFGTLWWFRPFADDPSLLHFVRNVDALPVKAWYSLGACLLAGAWFGLGRPRRQRKNPAAK